MLYHNENKFGLLHHNHSNFALKIHGVTISLSILVVSGPHNKSSKTHEKQFTNAISIFHIFEFDR